MEPIKWPAAVARVEAEFREMPDLMLTLAQLRRLCGLPQDECEAAASRLVLSGFLRQTANGRLVRFGVSLPSYRRE